MLRSLPQASIHELTRENSGACAVILPLCQPSLNQHRCQNVFIIYRLNYFVTKMFKFSEEICLLKCHYDENRIFSIETISKHKQVPCMRKKMLFTIFKYLFLLLRYSSF